MSLLLHQTASAAERNGLELGAESAHIDNEDVHAADPSGPEGDVLQPTEVLITGRVQGQRARAPRTRYGVAFTDSSTAR